MLGRHSFQPFTLCLYFIVSKCNFPVMTYLCLLQQLQALTITLQMQGEAGEKKGFLQLCPDL